MMNKDVYCFTGHFKEISIAKVLLGLSQVVWKRFGDVDFPTPEKVWREKKRKFKLFVKYNSLDHKYRLDIYKNCNVLYSFSSI